MVIIPCTSFLIPPNQKSTSNCFTFLKRYISYNPVRHESLPLNLPGTGLRENYTTTEI